MTRGKIATFVVSSVVSLIAGVASAVPINLLPLGDSITETRFYISPLENELISNGYEPTLIANEGHSGYGIQGGIPGAPDSGIREHVGPGVSIDFLNHPNVNSPNTFILLMIGTNDVNLGFQLGTSQVQTRMSGLIAAIRTEAPLAHLVVAQITPNLGSLAKDLAVRKFNADIAPIVTGTNIGLVDMYTPFQPDPTPYMADFLHPKQAGGNLMADVWFRGIQAQAVPEPTAIALSILGVLGLASRDARRRY